MIDWEEYERRVALAREAEAAGTSESFGVMVPWRELAELLRLAKRDADAAHAHAIRELHKQLTKANP